LEVIMRKVGNIIRVALLIGAASAACAALATPGSGIAVSNIANGRFGTLLVNTEGDKAGKWGMLLKTLDASDMGADRVVVQPQGYGGWHSHPAPNFLIVVRGTIEWRDSLTCDYRTLHVGDTLIEPAFRAHDARNPAPVGGEVAEIIGIRIKPTAVIGPAFRIDEPEPNNCQQ
jgi:quercetin dioxygenase-like cupin family protein